MMKTNLSRKVDPVFNSEGVKASRVSPMEELKRTVMSCLLWEDSFYEDGEAIADRIKRLVPLCDPAKVAALAVHLRTKGKLRHAPLLIVRELARVHQNSIQVSKVLCDVIQRADELAEFVAIYWRDGRRPLSKQVKKGLRMAFAKFNEYALAKYQAPGAITLRDVMFLACPFTTDPEQRALWGRLVNKQLATPDTWETALSSGADKKSTWERLLSEGKLGSLALLKNLRNMQEVGVNGQLIQEALLKDAPKTKALPFRYIAAARAVPAFEPWLDEAMQLALGGMEQLPGHTVVLIDTSPSMDAKLSAKSDLTRKDAAAALAILLRGVCEEVRVFAFSSEIKEVPPRRGMALGDAIQQAVPSNGTLLGKAVRFVSVAAPEADRLIVFTDEETQDTVTGPHCKGFLINVATTQHGVGYGEWTHINGFSESVVAYIQETERPTLP
jgi:60 kDa SS-A/Ro ribonucleoprotein